MPKDLRIANPPKKLKAEIERLAALNKRTVPAQIQVMLEQWIDSRTAQKN